MSATQCARSVALALVELGVRHVVLSPGSRSAPLAFAWETLARQGKIELHVRVDERGAAYLALGLAKATGTIVPIVTTSGTAVGNLLPAVMEAAHSGVPIMVLSTDRPVSVLHTGANQVTHQAGVFDRFVRASAQLSGAEGNTAAWVYQVGRLAAAALGTRSADPGPVHLNKAFAEPLVPSDDVWPEVRPTHVAPRAGVGGGVDGAGVDAGWGSDPTGNPRDAEVRSQAGGDGPVESSWGQGATGVPRDTGVPRETGVGDGAGPRTVVLVGDCPPRVGQRAWEIAVAAGLPLLSEPSGNARRTPAIRGYRVLLNSDLGERIERVLLFGHPTLSRPVSRLLARQDIETIAVTTGARWIDPGCAITRVVNDIRPAPGDPAWLAAWQDADRALPLPAGSQAAAEDDALGSPARIDNASAGALDDLGATAGGDRAGADPRGDLGSTAGLDRAADGLDGHSVAAAVWSATARAQQPLVIGSSHPIRDLDLAPVLTTAPPAYANRGLAGIDGTIATALGVALASGPTTLLVGDLTFLHDAGSLLIGPLERRPDLRIVVVNDDGGSIFHILEQGAPEHADAFERIFGTPTGANLAGIAAGYGWRHRRITSHAQLIEAIAEPVTAEILEVRVSRAHRRAQATAVNKMA